MIKVIKHLQKNMPTTDILLVGVSDRAMKSQEGMVTMPGVKNLLATQQSIAAECGIAFWNTIDAMALDGGILGYVKAKPAMANLDYTHINIRGGALIAKHLFEALEYGKRKYIERNEYND